MLLLGRLKGKGGIPPPLDSTPLQTPSNEKKEEEEENQIAGRGRKDHSKNFLETGVSFMKRQICPINIHIMDIVYPF